MVIQADWVMPELAMKDTFDGLSVQGQVRALFVYEPDVSVLRQRLDGRPDTWWSEVPEEEKAARTAMFHARGLEDKRKAEALGLPVVESLPFETLLDRALAALG
jgi:hypothetical protein